MNFVWGDAWAQVSFLWGDARAQVNSFWAQVNSVPQKHQGGGQQLANDFQKNFPTLSIPIVHQSRGDISMCQAAYQLALAPRVSVAEECKTSSTTSASPRIACAQGFRCAASSLRRGTCCRVPLPCAAPSFCKASPCPALLPPSPSTSSESPLAWATANSRILGALGHL